MGRAGDCVTCFSPRREEIEAARAAGRSYANLARDFGLAEASVRRHFKLRHDRPKPAPAPRAHPQVEVGPLVTMERLRRVAAQFDIAVADLVFHHLYCRKGDIALVSDAEGDELLEMMREHATPEEFAEMFPA